MVARIMCAGSEGKRELLARPIRRVCRGDHSFDAEMVGILVVVVMVVVEVGASSGDMVSA